MSAHHVNGKTCPLCTEKMAGLDPAMLPWAVWVKENFETAHFSWCWRGKDDQENFFRAGKTRAHWPHSPHNVEHEGKPASVAFDLFEIRADNVPNFAAEFCERVWTALEAACGGAVQWSGTWVSFKEKCHFQLASFAKSKTPGA